ASRVHLDIFTQVMTVPRTPVHEVPQARAALAQRDRGSEGCHSKAGRQAKKGVVALAHSLRVEDCHILEAAALGALRGVIASAEQGIGDVAEMSAQGDLGQ